MSECMCIVKRPQFLKSPKFDISDRHPSIRELHKLLLPKLAPHWKDFCIAADFDEDGTKLTIIEKKWPNDPRECCRELLMEWRKHKNPTWRQVVECLREARCGQLAEDVEDEITSESNQLPKLQSPSSSASNETSPRNPHSQFSSPPAQDVQDQQGNPPLLTLPQTQELPQIQGVSNVTSTLPPPPTARPLAQRSVTSSSAPTKEDISFSEPKPISLRFPSEQIRAYQKELAQPGLNGENYIICAPTGSGKTLVATIIISEHFRQRQMMGKRGKVIFIVQTQQLAHQQKVRIEQDLEGVRAIKVVGSGETELSIASLVPSIDLVVCTAGKLCNELRAKTLTMGQFSLLIVDECHHTVGSDCYSEVMESYLLEKLRGDPSKVPQVVGLTASPGAGKGRLPTLLKAINHQFNLCAHLDASSGIKMVTENMEELLACTNKPDHILRVLEHRSHSEPFYNLILREMECLEEFINGGPRFNRSSLKYGKWVGLEKKAAEMRKAPEERDRISILEHLYQCYLTLITYEDFNSEDAIQVLRDIEEYPNKQATPTEKHLNARQAALISHLSQLPRVSNPLLIGVEHILVSQFSKTPESKGIFFVREIRHTQYVQRWVESRPSLRRLLRIASIVGYTRAGMTKEHQLEVIRGFRTGKYNLLVSTSVLEEGLDVAACNLVIRFQVMTNEIAEVQAQGRARAMESKMYTIMSSQSHKEFHQLINEEKKELALKAPHLVTSQCKSPRFRAKQKEILFQREAREKALAMRKLLWKPENVIVVCKKCKTAACKGNDIFCCEGNHYAVLCKKFRETKIERRPHPKAGIYGNTNFCYKIYCRECNEYWGWWVWWLRQCMEYPVLKCASFSFHHKNEVHLGKKWSDVPFAIPPLPEDFDDDD